MMTLRANKQKLYYALQSEEVPVYQKDSDGNIIYYTDSEGNQIPMETGDTELNYAKPAEMYSSIAMSGGEAEAQEYGLSVGDYNATLICSAGEYPLTEGALIWHNSEVGYKDDDNEIPDEHSADYMVLKCSDSLNFTKYILKAIVK